METTGPGSTSSTPPPDVAWDNIGRFVRQLSHDLRNHLNAVELQSAYIAEIVTEPEVKDEVKRLRVMLSSLGVVLQKLSSDVAPPRPSLIPYKAADFLEDLQSKFAAATGPERRPITWGVEVGDAMVQLDPQLLPLALSEMLDNANRGGGTGPLEIKATIDESGRFQLNLIEPQKEGAVETENWGKAPLRNITQGHYGLGLHRARLIIEAHGGQFAAHYDQASQALVSTIILPTSSAQG